VRASPDSHHSFALRLYYSIACLTAPAYGRIEEKYLATHTFMQHCASPVPLNVFAPFIINIRPGSMRSFPISSRRRRAMLLTGQPLRYRLVAGGTLRPSIHWL
jgi:hypothetical protein